MKKAALLLAISLVFAGNLSAAYDPAACIDSLTKKGLNACLSSSGSYSCFDMPQLSAAAYQICTPKDTYMPVQSTEAYNPRSGDRKTVSSPDEMLKVLADFPDYEARPCYCCCG